MPKYILSKEQMYAADAAMTRAGISGEMLMLNAARAVADAAMEFCGAENGRRSALILCGAGNNAGDGYAAAWLLGMKGANVKVIELFKSDKLPSDARKHYEIALGAPNVSIHYAETEADVSIELDLFFPDVIIDAIFGTGLSREPEGVVKAAIEAVNASKARVLSVDIPSGVDGTSGQTPGVAVRATKTITFQHEKLGHWLFPGRGFTGELIAETIGFYSPKERYAEMLTDEDLHKLLPQRRQNAHKGDSGRGIIIAGSRNMAGAAILCARAALRSGVGLLTAAVPQELSNALRISVPEAMLLPLPGDKNAVLEALDAAFEGKNAIAAGPGMGKHDVVGDIIRHILSAAKLSILLDADALNALKRGEKLSENVVITPHPGEMARLCGISAGEIARNPLETAVRFSKEWNCTILLKGATSVVASYDGRLTLNATGNPGLAKGGSGDVLTGVILALLCQGFEPYDAARLGAYLLGKAAEAALETKDARSLLASDVIEALLRGV